MSDLDDARDTLAELTRQRDALAREAATLAAVAARDPLLAAALGELSRRQRLDVLAGLDDPETDVLLGALVGPDWQRRLHAAVPPCEPCDFADDLDDPPDPASDAPGCGG